LRWDMIVLARVTDFVCLGRREIRVMFPDGSYEPELAATLTGNPAKHLIAGKKWDSMKCSDRIRNT